VHTENLIRRDAEAGMAVLERAMFAFLTKYLVCTHRRACRLRSLPRQHVLILDYIKAQRTVQGCATLLATTIMVTDRLQGEI
jgi:hypothetical protein